MHNLEICKNANVLFAPLSFHPVEILLEKGAGGCLVTLLWFHLPCFSSPPDSDVICFECLALFSSPTDVMGLFSSFADSMLILGWDGLWGELSFRIMRISWSQITDHISHIAYRIEVEIENILERWTK